MAGRVEVEICVCANCVLCGAMDLVEAVEVLGSLRGRLHYRARVETKLSPHLGQGSHRYGAPYAKVNGKMLENTVCENLMAAILEEAEKGERKP